MISIDSVVMTIILFTSIFIVTLLNNLRQIHLSKPIELLKGGQVEKKSRKRSGCLHDWV